jgi:hypothetical protein
MTPDRIGVYIPDPTYGQDDDSTWDVRSEAFKRELEARYALKFDRTDIGPSFDLPSFVAWIVFTAVVLFFQGKRISENLEAWIKLCEKLRNFSGYRPTYERNGAAVLVIREISVKLGRFPNSVKLIGYEVVSFMDESDLTRTKPLSEIRDPAPEQFLAYAVHVFRIEADGHIFRATVKGETVEILEEPQH